MALSFRNSCETGSRDPIQVATSTLLTLEGILEDVRLYFQALPTSRMMKFLEFLFPNTLRSSAATIHLPKVSSQKLT